MEKFKNCIIKFKSGDGESFIEEVYDLNKNEIDCSDEDERQWIEDTYHREIFQHDHDRNTGYGHIKIVNGIVERYTYQEEFD